MKNTYDLIFHLCGHGVYPIHGLDYEETHAPVASNTYLRFFIVLCAVLDVKIVLSDVRYTFQITNSFANYIKPLYFTCPPFYMAQFP